MKNDKNAIETGRQELYYVRKVIGFTMLVINYLKIEIELIEKNDQPHICKNCKIDITDIKRPNGNIPSIELQSVNKQEHDTTIAESLLNLGSYFICLLSHTT